MKGFYYLHSETRDLIFKKFRPEDDSPFVVKIWEIDTSLRQSAWFTAIDAAAHGANPDRIDELIDHWKLTDIDAHKFITYLNNQTGFKDDPLTLTTDSDGQFVVKNKKKKGIGKRAFDALVAYVKKKT